ncbi:PKD domain-containing protein [Desulfonema limicola]|nr:LamG-like jellyroll fold domain-containing protein [Desulfonema limicola]
MKIKYSNSASVFVFLIIFSTAYLFCINQCYADCPEGMISYYRLDENNGVSHVDFSGNTQAQCADKCPSVTVYGRVGRGQIFNGSTTGINISPPEIFNWQQHDSFSIEYWIKKSPETLSNDEVIIGRYDQANGLKWWTGVGSSGVAAFVLKDTKGNEFSLYGTKNLADGLWHHVAAVRDGDTDKILLYVDLRLEASLNAVYSGNFSSENSLLNIGWINADKTQRFKGMADEIAVYEKALPEQEIFSHFFNGLADLRWGYCDKTYQVKIMPLGDSITSGGTMNPDFQTGYRQNLYLNLEYLGYEVDFVGTQQTGKMAEPLFDIDNEAHFKPDSGWTAKEIAENIYSWLEINPADIIILHIGTYDKKTGAEDIELIFNEIDRFSKDITIAAALIINQQTVNPDITLFNKNVAAMIKNRIIKGDKIIIADLENSLIYPDDMIDEFHPAPAGYAKIANTLLNSLLKTPEHAPIAIVESVKTAFEGETIILDGSSSFDPNGPIAYHWIQLSGIPVQLSGSDTAIALFTIPVSASDMAFRLVVQDQTGLSGSDEIVINVNKYLPPKADPGEDQTVNSGQTITLDGSASFAESGEIESYQWIQISGISVNLTSPDEAVTEFTAPDINSETGEQDKTLVFELIVKDHTGVQSSERISIYLQNTLPRANAGYDQVVIEGTTVILDASASFDPDGGISSYKWTQISGTDVTISDFNAIKPTFVAPAVGTSSIIFELTVTDKQGNSDTDEIQIIVNSNGISNFPDSITAFISAAGRPMGIKTDTSSASLVKLNPVSMGAITPGGNSPESLIYGLINMEIRLDKPAASAVVTVYFPEPAPEDALWYSYSKQKGWIDYGSNAVFSLDRKQVQLTLTDGAVGDEEDISAGINGKIRNTSGLGIPYREDKDDLISCFINTCR